MISNSLNSLQQNIRQYIEEDNIPLALKELESYLLKNYSTYDVKELHDNVTLFKRRNKSLRDDYRNKVITYEVFQVKIN